MSHDHVIAKSEVRNDHAESVSTSKGVLLSVCADDLSAALPSSASLSPLHDVLCMIERVFRQEIHASKYEVVPISLFQVSHENYIVSTLVSSRMLSSLSRSFHRDVRLSALKMNLSKCEIFPVLKHPTHRLL